MRVKSMRKKLTEDLYVVDNCEQKSTQCWIGGRNTGYYILWHYGRLRN